MIMNLELLLLITVGLLLIALFLLWLALGRLWERTRSAPQGPAPVAATPTGPLIPDPAPQAPGRAPK